MYIYIYIVTQNNVQTTFGVPCRQSKWGNNLATYASYKVPPGLDMKKSNTGYIDIP